MPETTNITVGPYKVAIPCDPWKKMTPKEYAEQHESFGKHTAISLEIVDDCQEVWVFLSGKS